MKVFPKTIHNRGGVTFLKVGVPQRSRVNFSDLGGVIDIADPVTGTFVFIKLGYLKNFMSNKGSMKCL